MPDLTIEQVREAGRRAQHDIGRSRFWDYDPDPEVDSLTLNLPLYEQVGPFTYELPARGWHHATGCDCEFCRPEENHT